MSFPGGSEGKESACNAGDPFNPWVGKIPRRRKWQPTPVFSPGESQGWWSLVGCRLWGRTELARLKRLSMHAWYISLSMKNSRK